MFCYSHPAPCLLALKMCTLCLAGSWRWEQVGSARRAPQGRAAAAVMVLPGSGPAWTLAWGGNVPACSLNFWRCLGIHTSARGQAVLKSVKPQQRSLSGGSCGVSSVVPRVHLEKNTTWSLILFLSLSSATINITGCSYRIKLIKSLQVLELFWLQRHSSKSKHSFFLERKISLYPIFCYKTKLDWFG